MSKLLFPRTIAAVCLLSLLATPSFAIDIITRKSADNRLSGEVTAVSKTEITLKPQTGPDVKIPANDVEDIEWDGAPATMRGAQGQERNGNYEAAIKSYQAVLDELPVTANYVRTDLQFFIARSLAKLAFANSDRLPEAIARMKSFTERNVDSFRYYEAMDLLGRLQLSAQSYADAEAAFTKIEQSPFEDWKLSAKSSKARVQLAQGQIDQAISGFDAVINAQAGDEATKQRQLEAMLGKATALNQKNQFDQALTLLSDVIAKISEDNARLQAEAQVHRGAALLGQGKNQEALMAFLLVDILFSSQQDFHAEALYHLNKLWPTVGQPGRAEEARGTLETEYPNSPWTKKLTGA